MVVEHHTGRLRRLACRVADIEALDAQFGGRRAPARWSRRGARASLLAALLGRAPRERQRRSCCAISRQCGAGLRLAHQRDLAAGLHGQRFRQRAIGRQVADHRDGRRGWSEIVLRHEGSHHATGNAFDSAAGGLLCWRGAARRPRLPPLPTLRRRPPPAWPRAPRRRRSSPPPRHGPGNRPDRPWRPPRTMARLTQARPPSTATARMSMSRASPTSSTAGGSARSTAPRSGRARRRPARIRAARHTAPSWTAAPPAPRSGAPAGSRRHSARRAHSRPHRSLPRRTGAAMDLVQQAGPRAVVEDGVLAGAQLEHALQDLHALAHRMRAGEGAEVLVPAVSRAPVVGHAREAVPAELQVGIGLVVAERDVVARRQRLIRLFSSSSASASVRTTVVSICAILATIIAMRGDSCVLLK